jgi:hypothetical protein
MVSAARMSHVPCTWLQQRTHVAVPCAASCGTGWLHTPHLSNTWGMMSRSMPFGLPGSGFTSTPSALLLCSAAMASGTAVKQGCQQALAPSAALLLDGVAHEVLWASCQKRQKEGPVAAEQRQHVRYCLDAQADGAAAARRTRMLCSIGTAMPLSNQTCEFKRHPTCTQQACTATDELRSGLAQQTQQHMHMSIRGDGWVYS